MVYSARYKLDLTDQTIRNQISISVKNYVEKAAEITEIVTLPENA